ncbi:hypothetical protein PMI03_05098 [Rhizobium sp. AP16]|nr:hypothetical protein PMI03_05098 [Rhizobium sp. AP16]
MTIGARRAIEARRAGLKGRTFVFERKYHEFVPLVR